MTFVIHPLTQQNGEPKYTAADFRLTVSNFLTPATWGDPFGAVQGIRAIDVGPITTLSGSAITVKPHSGIIAPWAGIGAYAYAITSDITVPRPTTGDYYVVLVVEDPSQSHGSEPQGRVDLIPTSTPRASINGLVIAQTNGNSINGIETRLRNSTVIETVSKAELDLIKPVARTRGYVRFGEGIGEYEYDGNKWVQTNTNWIDIGYGDGYKASTFGNSPQIRVSNRLVFMQGVSFRKSGSVTSDDTPFGLIPALYRPRTTTYATVNGSSERSVNIQVNVSGKINVKGAPGGDYVAADGCWWTLD